MEFTSNSLLLQKDPKSTMAANHASNYSYTIVRFERTATKCQPRKDCEKRPGGRLNKKDGLTRYGDSHAKDKTS